MATRERKTEDLRREAEAAMHEATRLAHRMSSINDDIEAQQQTIREQRIAAAKRGDSPLAAMDTLGVEGLRAERDELPELHFAARLRAAALWIRAEEAQADELEPEISELEGELGPLTRAAQQAQARADEVEERLNELRGAVLYSRERSREQQRLLRRIEEEGPRPLV